MDHLDTLTQAFASTKIMETPSSDDTPGIDHLSCLPAELRNQIFELVLKKESKIEIFGSEKGCWHDWRDRQSCTIECEEASLSAMDDEARCLALSRTCRQFHSECTQHFYALNSFTILVNYTHHIGPVVRGFFDMIGSFNAGPLKNSTIRVDWALQDAYDVEETLTQVLEPILGVEEAGTNENDLTSLLEEEGRTISLELWCDFFEGDRWQFPDSYETAGPWHLQLDISSTIDICISLCPARVDLEQWQEIEHGYRLRSLHRLLDRGVARVLEVFEAWEDIAIRGYISPDAARTFKRRNRVLRMREDF